MLYYLRLFPMHLVLLSLLSLSHACSNAEMAGGSGNVKPSTKRKPVSGLDSPGSTTSSPIECLDASATANPGQAIDLKLSQANSSSTVSVKDNFGTATINGDTLTYTAPQSVPTARDVELTVTTETVQKKCLVKVIANGGILIADDGSSRALKANVYQLVANSKSMAAHFDGKNIAPIPGVYMAPNVHVPAQASNLGFPGMRSGVNTEDYVISFYGKIKVDIEGSYEFQVAADDGAVMWINSTKVIDADGWANVQRSNRGVIQLAKGDHDFKLNYYQGPACCIAIILKWKKPGDSNFSVVPASAFDRPD